MNEIFDLRFVVFILVQSRILVF